MQPLIWKATEARLTGMLLSQVRYLHHEASLSVAEAQSAWNSIDTSLHKQSPLHFCRIQYHMLCTMCRCLAE